MAGFVMVLLQVPFSSLIYGLAKQERQATDEFIIFREIPVAIGRIAILFLALLLVSNIKLVFPIAGLVYLFFLFL